MRISRLSADPADQPGLPAPAGVRGKSGALCPAVSRTVRRTEVFDLTAHLEDLSRALTSKLRLQPGIDYWTNSARNRWQCASIPIAGLRCPQPGGQQPPGPDGERSRHLRLSLRHSGDEAVITLTDNGPSLPAEYAEQVFEPFFSLTRAAAPGSGSDCDPHDPGTRRRTGDGLPSGRATAPLSR